MSGEVNGSLFELCIQQIRELKPDVSEAELLQLAHAREKALKVHIDAGYEKKLKADKEAAVKKAQKEAEEKKERIREKEW